MHRLQGQFRSGDDERIKHSRSSGATSRQNRHALLRLHFGRTRSGEMWSSDLVVGMVVVQTQNMSNIDGLPKSGARQPQVCYTHG